MIVIQTSSEEDLRLLEQAESAARSINETYELLTGKKTNFEVIENLSRLEHPSEHEEASTSMYNYGQYDLKNDDIEPRTTYCHFTKDYDERSNHYRNKCYNLTVPYALYAYNAENYGEQYRAVGMRALLSNKTNANIILAGFKK